MIKITVKPAEHSMHFKGHANYAAEGADVVCAAVSILFYTLAQTILSTDEKAFEEKPRVRIYDLETQINAKCDCKPKKEYAAAIDTVYQTILNGLNLMAENPQYSPFLKIVIINED